MANAPPQYPQPQPVPPAQPVGPTAVTPQPVYTPASQPVAAPQPVVYQPAPAAQPRPEREEEKPRHDHPEGQELLIYSHSNFFYWWPVWLTGYIMAAVTYAGGTYVNIGGSEVLFHHSKNLGVLFTLLFFLVVLITNVTLRGLSSAMLILGMAFGVLLLAYFGWWDVVLNTMCRVYIFMNMGFYMFFASLVFFVWLTSVFIYDRLHYWKIRPGQITHETVIGGAEKSYDTRGMVFEKHRYDLFRHWVLGLGSGDIQISTTGAKRETLHIPNVLFVNTKIDEVQRMISTRPDQFMPPQNP